MDKNTKIALGVGAAVVVGYFLYMNNSAKKKVRVDDANTPRVRKQDELVGTLLPADVYLRPENDWASTTQYLIDRPDVAKDWTDKDKFGNVVAFSHYVRFGAGEGENWLALAEADKNNANPYKDYGDATESFS
jgi:hypothetical protein